MTREECKNLLVSKINDTRGIRFDELAASYDMYVIDGFSEIFHPDLIRQLIIEAKIGEIKYTLPDKISVSYLIPKGSKVSLTNI
jgi:hypothetical protein